MRVAIYLRMSLDRELGIDRQREDCLALCERLGWEPVWYIDNDKSATKKNVIRHAYEQMCKDIDASEVEAIITWRSDRLYRTLRDLLPFIDLIQDVQKRGHRVPIETCQTGPIDLTTDSGRLNAKILAAVSENEGEVRTARQTRALKQIAESGGGEDKNGNPVGRAWGARAFGYTENHAEPALVPAEAAAVVQGYADLIAGATLYAIGMRWNRAGLLTTHNNPWTGTTVRRVLENPRYCGLRKYRKEIVGPGNWEPIVSKETWEAACAILQARGSDFGQGQPVPRATSRLLGGLLWCSECGKHLSPGKDSRGTFVYKCKNAMCYKGVRNMEKMDSFMRGLMIDKIAHTSEWMPESEDKEDIKGLHAERTTLQTAMDELGGEWDMLGGSMTKGQIRVATERLQQKLDAIQARLDRSTRNRAFAHIEEELAKGTPPPKIWDGMTLDRQRALIAMLCKVTIRPLGRKNRVAPIGTNIDVEWHMPD